MSGVVCPQYRTGFYAPKRGGIAAHRKLWRGCLGAWAPCLGPTGLTLFDWSGLGNHGTINGASFNPSHGKYSVDFDGINDTVSLTDLSAIDGVSSLQISLWVYPHLDEFCVFASKSDAALTAGWLLQTSFSANRKIIFYVCSNGSLVTTQNDCLFANTWTHIFVTYRNSSVQIALNGIQQATTTTGTIPSTLSATSTPVRIGGWEGGTAYFDGAADDIRIYREVTQTHKYLSLRRGIAHELAPRRRASAAVQFNRRRRLLVGAHS